MTPDAIDLDELRNHYGPSFGTGSTADLAVLADEIEALRARMAAEQELKQGYYDEGAKGWLRARAAEARVVELVGTLEMIAGIQQPADNLMSNIDIARHVLSATPAEALERANLGKELITASDAVIDSGRRMRSDPGSHEFALANLCAVMGRLAYLDTLKA